MTLQQNLEESGRLFLKTPAEKRNMLDSRKDNCQRQLIRGGLRFIRGKRKK